MEGNLGIGSVRKVLLCCWPEQNESLIGWGLKAAWMLLLNWKQGQRRLYLRRRYCWLDLWKGGHQGGALSTPISHRVPQPIRHYLWLHDLVRIWAWRRVPWWIGWTRLAWKDLREQTGLTTWLRKMARGKNRKPRRTECRKNGGGVGIVQLVQQRYLLAFV